MNNKNIPWWREGVIMFCKVSGYIIIPIILGSTIGNFLDKKYNSDNLFFLILIGVSFLVTIYLIWKEMKIYKNKLQKEEQNKQ